MSRQSGNYSVVVTAGVRMDRITEACRFYGIIYVVEKEKVESL